MNLEIAIFVDIGNVKKSVSCVTTFFWRITYALIGKGFFHCKVCSSKYKNMIYIMCYYVAFLSRGTITVRVKFDSKFMSKNVILRRKVFQWLYSFLIWDRESMCQPKPVYFSSFKADFIKLCCTYTPCIPTFTSKGNWQKLAGKYCFLFIFFIMHFPYCNKKTSTTCTNKGVQNGISTQRKF